MQPSHRTRLLLLVTLLATGSLSAKAASDAQDLRRLPPQYEAVAERLRNAQPQQYDFSKAMLSDVLRFLATDADISFFSLPDDSESGSKLITFSINASPFKVLETLCRANGLAILPDNDIWHIRPADDRELEGKSYEVRHNALERVEKITGLAGGAAGGAGGAGAGGAGAGAGGAAGGGGGGLAGGGGGGLSLQGPTDSFAVQRSEIINDIRAILDLPPEELEATQFATMAPGAGGVGGDPNAIANATNSNELSAFRRQKSSGNPIRTPSMSSQPVCNTYGLKATLPQQTRYNP